jgi:hypothetical protein
VLATLTEEPRDLDTGADVELSDDLGAGDPSTGTQQREQKAATA